MFLSERERERKRDRERERETERERERERERDKDRDRGRDRERTVKKQGGEGGPDRQTDDKVRHAFRQMKEKQRQPQTGRLVKTQRKRGRKAW